LKKFILYTLLVTFLFSGCKSHKTILEKNTASISKRKLLKRIDRSKFNARTFESRFNVKYSDNNQNFNGNGKLRILKDSIIWGSINFMGIPVVKFYLTPSQVQYYNKIDKTYYTGNYRKIREWLGTDLDFDHLQNLLLGNMLYDPSLLKDYELEISPSHYQLKNTSDLLSRIKINPDYKITEEWLTPSDIQKIKITYSDYKRLKKNLLPQKLHIRSFGPEKQLQLDLNYKNINLNKDLRFPFSIPDNYTKISF